MMAQAEQNDLAYLFRLRMTVNVKRDLERAMRHPSWPMPAKAGRARRRRCGYSAGAVNAASSCCAASWPATRRSPNRQTPRNRG